MSEETDNLLIALAQRCGGIEAMLESLFSFLKRKTDFYHIQQPGDKIGQLPIVRIRYPFSCLIKIGLVDWNEQDFRRGRQSFWFSLHTENFSVTELPSRPGRRNSPAPSV